MFAEFHCIIYSIRKISPYRLRRALERAVKNMKFLALNNIIFGLLLTYAIVHADTNIDDELRMGR